LSSGTAYALGNEVAVDPVAAFWRHAVVPRGEGRVDAEPFVDYGVEVGQLAGCVDGDVVCVREGGADFGDESCHRGGVLAEVVG
jgi:hypothetical protein